MARFQETVAAPLKHMGAPMQTIMLWSGWKTLGVARMYREAPPQNGGSSAQGKSPGLYGVGRTTKCLATRSRRAAPSPSGPPRSGQRSHMARVKVHDILGDGMRQPRVATEKGAEPPPPHPKGGGGGVRSLAAEVASLRGVKSHRREMVRKMILGMGEAMGALEGGDEGLRVLTTVLQRVRDEGDLEEEDDGYYSSSDDEGPVTAEMAARGMGEAGCVVAADSIWSRLVPRDLVSVYEKAQRDRRSATNSHCTPGWRGPLDSMLESLQVDTGGLHLTSAPPSARMFLTCKNKLKSRAILDARQVNSSGPRRPPKFRLLALEGIRRRMGDAKRTGGNTF